MRKGAFDPKAIIADWQAAFLAANGREPKRIPRYERGWFVFRTEFGSVSSRYRRADVETMTGRLKSRIEQSAEGKQP